MKALSEDLKTGNLKQVYLFYGDEPYLCRQYRKRLRQAKVSADDNMNYNYYEGKDVSPEGIIDVAETLPFFAENRLIIWENSDLFKSANEKMYEYLKTVPPTTSILFVETNVDKRGKMFKLLSSWGSAIEFPVQKEDVLCKWIGSVLIKENKKISERTALYLLNKTGTGMDYIYAELSKLISYCLMREVITESDIDAVCSTNISNRIFAMVDAVADKQQQLALALYDDLLSLKEPPMRIMFWIARQFNNLLQIKELKIKGFDNKYISERIGLPGFVVGKCVAQAAKFSKTALYSSVIACVEADEAVKTGKLNDRLSVELLIIKCINL